QGGGSDEAGRQRRNLRQNIHRGELADLDDAGRCLGDMALVEGEAADSDDRGFQNRAQPASGIEEVAAVHDPVLSFRISIVFPMGLLWRRGVYGTNGLTETRLRFSEGDS